MYSELTVVNSEQESQWEMTLSLKQNVMEDINQWGRVSGN